MNVLILVFYPIYFRSLAEHYPGQVSQIRKKETETQKHFDTLKDLAVRRSAYLNEAYGQQGFLADSRDLVSSEELLVKMSTCFDLRKYCLRIADLSNIVLAAKLVA